MNYREEVLKNCPGFSTDAIEKKLSLAGLGIAGEAAEILELTVGISDYLFGMILNTAGRLKVIKEMGDVYWYLEYLCATLGVTREDCLAVATNTPVTRLHQINTAADICANAGGIADLIKKVLHHEVPIEKRCGEIVLKMGLIYHGLYRMGHELAVTPDQVMHINVEKLRARHPNGWTPASQQAKADETR